MANGAGASQLRKQAIKMGPDVSATWQKINPLAISPAREQNIIHHNSTPSAGLIYVYVNTHAALEKKARARSLTFILADLIHTVNIGSCLLYPLG
jgi:hypothetical protein